MSRPRKLDRPRLMQAVCVRVAQGELVRYAAKAEGVNEQRIREWGLTEEFAALYARAREQQAHALAEQTLEIADGRDALTALYEEAVEGIATPDNYKVVAALRANIVNRDRIRVDTRKWLTSKIAPKLYGERIDITSGGESLLPLEARKERIAAILAGAKARTKGPK